MATKTKSQIALEELNKKYGIKTQTTNNTIPKQNDKGKQSNSASSASTNETKKTKSQTALEKLNDKYGINGTTPQKGTALRNIVSSIVNNVGNTVTNAKNADDTVIKKPDISYEIAAKYLSDRGLNKYSGISTFGEWGRTKKTGENYEDYLYDQLYKAVESRLGDNNSSLVSASTKKQWEDRKAEFENRIEEYTEALRSGEVPKDREAYVKNEIELLKNTDVYKAKTYYDYLDSVLALDTNPHSKTYDLTTKSGIDEYLSRPQSTSELMKNGIEAWLGENPSPNWKIAGTSVLSGVASFNKSLAATADWLLPTDFLGKYDPFSAMNDSYSRDYDYWEGERQKSLEGKGKAENILSEIGKGVVETFPNTLLAVMTGGYSAGAQAVVQASTTSTGLFSTIGNAFKSVSSNPTFWTSMAQTLGTDYEEARKNGADDITASITAILKSGVNAAIEVGGGIETLPNELKSGSGSQILKWVKSSLEEGNEGVVQGLVSETVDKFMYDHDKEIASLTNEEAIINPQRMAKEYGMGAAVGAVLTGGPVATIEAAQTLSRAKDVNQQNEFIDTIIEDEETLNALIEEGKACGDLTDAERLAYEVEEAKEKGKVTRKQVRKLIEANEKYIKQEEMLAEDVVPVQEESEQPAKKPVEYFSTAPSLEQAAREVVAERTRRNPVVAVETKSIAGETITPEDAKKASGYGKHGSELLANATNNAEGKSLSEVKGEMHEAYVAGRTNRNININSDLKQEAYFAGKKDKVLQDMEDGKNASNIVVNKESGFSTENLPNDVTETQVEILDTMAKALGVKAYMTSGLKGNAEYDRTTGEVPIDVSFERKSQGRKVSIVYHGAHEMAVHAVVDRSGEVGREFVREMYKFLAGDEMSDFSLAEQKRNAYAKQGVEISFEKAMEEVVASDVLILYGNNEAKFKRAIERIANGTNTKAKQGLRKYIDLLNKFIQEIKILLSRAPKSKKAQMRAELNEVIRLRDMFESAFGTAVDNVKAAENAVAERTSNEQSSTESVKSDFSLKEDTDNLSPEDKKVVDALGKGAKAVTNKNGDMLIATNKDKNTIMYSLKTYEDGGKEKLEQALRTNGHTEAEIQKTISYVDEAADYLKILAAGYARTHNYTALSNHLIADVITNVKTGKQVISSIVNNGDYPVNIDLALICKKRVAYMNLMNRLIDDGVFDKVNYGGEAIAKVNDLLRMDGFETACLGCFVESRRLQFQTWAETIVSEWNEEVDKRTKNASNFNFADGKAKLTDAEMDALAEELKNAGKKNAQGNLNLGQGSVQTRMGRLLDKVPSLRKHLTVADLLKPDGLTALRAYDSNLFSIVKSRYGAASPKIVQDYNPYASEIAMMTFSSVKNITSNAVKGADAYRRKVINEMGGRPVKQKGETAQAFKERKAEFNTKVEDEAIRRYLYDIGGARIQSFSDFMIENVFDYIQIFADLSAKRLPLHGYTKEIVALRLFGMTGAKWNGSLIAHVDREMGKEYAGLLPASEAKDGNAILVHTEDGDYAIGFDDYARNKATNGKSFIQSIGMKDIMALQLDPRYSSNVGSITIGVSDKQILAMLDSPLFRFVIPYHSSGMLPQFAKLVGVDLYNDYTDYQNTTVKQWFDAYGNPCNPISDVDVDTSYNFNAEVQKTGDAKKAAANYLKWCDNKHPVYGTGKKLVGYVTFNPKFSNSPYGTDFTKHENYYKLLEDFNVYDNITEESAVQGAVTMNFPSEQNRLSASEMDAYKERLRDTGIFSEKEIEKYSKIADKTFKELIADEVKGRAEYQQAQAPKWENTVKNVEQMLLGDHARTSHSLKGTNNMSIQEQRALAGIVDDAKSGDKEAMGKLAKYVDSGSISTEYYDSLIEKYGAIPYGENPSRDIQVPKKTAKDKKVSQTVRTILEAKATPDEALPTIEKMVEDGVFSYEVYTDKQAIKDAEDMLAGYGWVDTYNTWLKDVEDGVVSKQHTVQGWALYNNAINTATTTTSETEKRTAMETALNVLDAMIRHQRNAAQALQATRVLKKLTPETQLYAVQKSVSAFQKELTDKYGKKAPELKIDEELAANFLEATTAEERLEVEKEIYKDIGRQMPSRFADKWNAWRYLAMLGNPRTHIRNIVGNAGFAPIVATKNLTATVIESVVAPVVRLSGKKMLRGKSIVFGSKNDRALLKAAWSDYSNVADIVSNGGKYNDSATANQQIEEGRKIFKSKLLAPVEWARKGNSKLLEMEDVWFSKPHYAYALAQYCKANNITADQIKKGVAIAPAREYAIKEAQKATYKDTNAFSQFVSNLGRKDTKKNWVTKAGSMAIEGILPFRKTPANILARGVEYSPIGLLKGLSYDLAQVGRGKIAATEAIDNISAGLTGTGLLALGAYLAAQGLIRGHGEDEEKEKEFKEMMGHQAYSLELPNGQSVTLDWLAPEALPFFVGVNLWETSTSTDKKTNLSTILKSVSNISEPMLEMSCLQGLNDLFESVGYASSNDTSGLFSVLSSAVTSYLTQAIPTLLGQGERTGEEHRMTTYTEKNAFLTGDMQYTLGKASAKIPFWDYNQIPYIDAWGRKEASGTALKRGLNNFLNPAYTSEIKTSDMEKELLRLYEATGEGGVFPTRADKYFTVDKERKDLTAEEYVRYATLKGEKSYKLVSELVNSDTYANLDDGEKVKAIQEAYDYANQKAKQAISNYNPDKWVAIADDFGDNIENYLSFRSDVSATRTENGGKISKEEVADIILGMGQSNDDAWKMYLSIYDSEPTLYAYDNGVEAEDYFEYVKDISKAESDEKLDKKEVVDVIRNLNVDNDDAWTLYLSKYDSETAVEAEKHGIDAKVFMKAVVDMKDIKPDYIYNGKRVDGNKLTSKQRDKAKEVNGSRREKIERYLNANCNNVKEYLFLLGTEYEKVKEDYDYIKYFGK